MTDPTTPGPDLGALSAKLREDDQQFRRTFVLGQLGVLGQFAEGAAAADPVESARPESARPETPGGSDLRDRLLALIEARTGIDGAGGAGERLDRVLMTMPAAAVVPWLGALDAESSDGPTWAPLIEALTVNETYFFRDTDQLEFLRRRVLAELVAARKSEAHPRLTCWCAGCSSGEEAYSLAVLIVETLREAEQAELRSDGRIHIHPRWRINVLGTDLDRTILRDAPTGRYPDFPMGPFRALPDHLAVYFEQRPPHHANAPPQRVVRPEIRSLVGFLPFNLASIKPPTLDLDLVLCRNVLIYLSDRARSHAQALFHRALSRDGTLALGPTDTLRQSDLFQPLWGPGAVLYRKK